ncbi:ABC transporter substrate-binding protein [Actinacidiphila acididurans]|uniref:ABC transporter substrate-binding protein n=1 Tax=Actinacidiphila acididurans TaxID=2784346 RepID=A0ABS2U1V9_9ACTN|nr:ABC transporter substrate-binding protein [Actinacidiphila acididurans]MBM9509594.1 ABC transporter substrate-binding protein [Actinacidiphila acididurans]
MTGPRTAALAGWLAALALVLAACGSSSSPSHAPAAAPSGAASAAGARDADLSGVTLRVGQTGWAQFKAALQVAGLDHTPYRIKWAVFPGGDKQLQALQAGALDVAQTSDIPPVFAAAATTPKWRVVAVQRAATLQQNVVAAKGSGITGIAGLKGKKVGYVQATTAQFFLYKLLVQNGLTWNDIHAVPLTPQDGVAALSSGSIDALATYGNSVVTTVRQGATVIGSGQDILSGNFPWEASTDVVADPARSAALVDLLARVNKAYVFIRDGHEEELAKIDAQDTDQPQSQALEQIRANEQQIPTAVRPGGAAQIAKEQDVADTFSRLGVLPGKVDVASYWSDALSARLTGALGTS